MAMTMMNYGDNMGRSFRGLLEHDPMFRSVAYFSMEIGIRPEIPTYSGGLGILAGDIVKSSADLGVPMTGVTLLFRKGYFHQVLDADGAQKELPEKWKPEEYLTLLPNKVSVMIEGRQVQIRAWVYDVIGQDGFNLPVYFLDTDFEENNPVDRNLTWNLYGGDLRYRLCQEIILGFGGLRMLRDLGYRNIKTFHLNEGHAGFLALELLREQGYEDLEKIKNRIIFTTHTPVAAGHDYFPMDMVHKVMDPVFVEKIKHHDMGHDGISMTDLALKCSRYINGVSIKHGEVSRKMFNRDDIDSITNGVHTETWTCPGFAKLYDKYIPGWSHDPSRFMQALSIPDAEIWKAHQAAKMKLFARVLEETGQELDVDMLTIGFARRAAGYKRADLIFSDPKKLIDICSGKVQFIFAGKAHPSDEPAKEILKRIYAAARQIGGTVPIVFLENYNMELSKVITPGVDVWLNNPCRPREASGTSGMKCTHNGVMNLSVLDGWWIEGCIEDSTGWAIGPEPSENDMDGYDEMQDALDLYAKLKNKVIPTYYERRQKWILMMKRTIAVNASYFNTHRVVKEYCDKAYGTVFRGL